MQLLSFTLVVWISSVCLSFRTRRLADSVTGLPFLYQVMLGGGTALLSHRRVNDVPARVFTTRGDAPPLPLILGGTKRHRKIPPPVILRPDPLWTHLWVWTY